LKTNIEIVQKIGYTKDTTKGNIKYKKERVIPVAMYGDDPVCKHSMGSTKQDQEKDFAER